MQHCCFSGTTARTRWLLVGLLSVCMGLARADGPLDGQFEVRSAFAVVSHGVVELSARVRYPLTDKIRAALQDGVTLAFDMEIVLEQPRRFWFNASIVQLDVRRELSYHVVTERYVLRDEDGTELDSFPTLEAALQKVGQIDNWPIAVEPQLRGEGPWEISVRAGVRRGLMPDALRAVVFWSDAWHRTSDWYTWTLVR